MKLLLFGESMPQISGIFQNIYNDLKNFLTYLASLSGLLSGFSAFFPLVNKTFSVILPPKEYPDASLLIATLACVFLIFHHFTERNTIKNYLAKPKKSAIFIPISLAIVYVFIVQHIPYVPILTEFPITDLPDLPTILYWIIYGLINFIKPTIYVLIFYFFTDIFATLAVFELQNRRRSSS